MVRVAGVRFKKAGKIYYFDPDGYDIEKGTNVIVETARGLEFGVLVEDLKEVDKNEIVAPLKKIVRVADDKDLIQHQENLDKKELSLALCQEKVDKHGLDMKLIDVEHTFDKSKIIFYFTADGRVDFRELVKDLAGVFKKRIELRQIGVRDEAKLVGGIGTCGKSLCCHSWLQEFEPVSIKMAKVQNLSLNPTKISGICGRLMCCLKFENDVYCDLSKGMPDVGERVRTPEGEGIVVETNILEGIAKVRLLTEDKDENGTEKLAADYKEFNKKQIRRFGKKKEEKEILEELGPELLDEIRNILED